MTLRRSQHLLTNVRDSEMVALFLDNGPEDVSVDSDHRGVVVLSVGHDDGSVYTDCEVDLDPDAARTVGTALLAAARVAERQAVTA